MDNPYSDAAAESGRAEQAQGMAPSESPAGRSSGLLIHALAGLEAGVVGVIWMFGCFVVAAFWSHGSIWSVPNLFSTVFYGDFAWQQEFLRTTWAGLALIVVVYGLPGAVWGCFWRDRRKVFLTLYGALVGLAAYYFFFEYFWTRVDPVIPLYAPVRQLQVAHILWGAALARSPVYARRIAAAIRQPVAPRGAHQDAAQTVSGELIL